MTKRLSFWKRLYLSMTDFRLYPFIIKENFFKALKYYFQLLLLVATIFSFFCAIKFYEEYPKYLELYNSKMPEFAVENGIITTEENTSLKLNSDVSLIVDTSTSYSNISSILDREKEFVQSNNIVVNNDRVSFVKHSQDGFYEVMSFVSKNMPSTNKASFREYLNDSLESNSTKAVIILVLIGSLFMAILLASLFNMVMLLITEFIMNMIFSNNLKFQDYFKILFYSTTLAIFLEIFTLMYVGSLSETVNFMLVLINTVYIFYAFRAIKLDALIMKGIGNTAEEKIKSALENAQKELEKQIDELEQKEAEKYKEAKIIEKRDANDELQEKKANLEKAQKEYEEALKNANKEDIFDNKDDKQ